MRWGSLCWCAVVAGVLWLSGVMGSVARANLLPCGLLTTCPAPVSPAPTSPVSPPGTTTPTRPVVLAVPGGEYDGRNGHTTYADLAVARDGERVAAVAFVIFAGRCSDGQPYETGLGRSIRRGGTIDRRGHVSYSAESANASYVTRAGRRLEGREQISLSARFAGASVSGTFRLRFKSRALRCSSGTVRFAAYLDGSPRAPLRAGGVETGRYVGTESDTYTILGRKPPRRSFALDVFLPWHVVTSMRLQWDLFCANRTFRTRSTFVFLPIRTAADLYQTFRSGAHGIERLTRGIAAYWSYNLYGEFVAGTRNRYSVEGQLAYNVAYYYGKRLISGCFQTANFIGNNHARIS